MKRPLPSLHLLAACTVLLLAGCGDDSDPLASKSSRGDISALADGAAVIGTATDFGVAQLYQGTTAVASLDARGALALTLRDAASGGPGTPAVQSVSVDAAVLASASGGTASGTFIFVSDRLAPDGSNLPAGWWHARLSLAGQTIPFTVTGDDTGVATATGGAVDLYVLDGATTVTSAGNWVQSLDVWTVAGAAAPVHVDVKALDGGAYGASITSIRHLHRTVTRTDGAVGRDIIAKRIEVATVDGDATALLAAVPSAGSLSGVVSGPIKPDSGSPGVPGIFARGVHATTVPGGASHTWEWQRNAHWTVTQTKKSGESSWTSTTATSAADSYYIIRDGSAEGVFTALGLINRWRQVIDLARTARRL